MRAINKLLDEFKAAFEAGREIDLPELLAHAPEDERQELGERIDTYLMKAPRRSWDAAAYAQSPAKQSVERVWESLEGVSGTWPNLLPRLRKAAQIKRQDLVGKLAEALGVAQQEERVAGYYHDMEHGRLPAAGVSATVIEALATILGAAPEEIRRAGHATPVVEPIADQLFAREALPDEDYTTDSDASGPPDQQRSPEPGRDEVDRLFTGG